MDSDEMVNKEATGKNVGLDKNILIAIICGSVFGVLLAIIGIGWMVKTSKAEDQIVTSVIEAEKNSKKDSVVLLETGNEPELQKVPEKPEKVAGSNPFGSEPDSSFAAGDLSDSFSDSDNSHAEDL